LQFGFCKIGNLKYSVSDSSIFLDTTPLSPLKVSKHVGGCLGPRTFQLVANVSAKAKTRRTQKTVHMLQIAECVI
jgi:hypothetical protein